MSGAQLLILVVATALVSSLATLALGWIVFRRWIRPRLETRLEAFAESLEARVRAGASAAGSAAEQDMGRRRQNSPHFEEF